jgi:hypothetical protein
MLGLSQGSACLTFQQVKNLVNLTYGISVRQSIGKSRGGVFSSQSGRKSSMSVSERSASRQSSFRGTPSLEAENRGSHSEPGADSFAKRASSSQSGKKPKFHLEDVVEEELLVTHEGNVDVAPGDMHAESSQGRDEAIEEEDDVTFTEDDELFAAAILKHKGDPYKIFKLIEADGDGELDANELKRATERILKVSLTFEEAKDMFSDADWDGGGTISATEFCLYLGMPSGGKRAKLADLAEERVRLVSNCYNRLAGEQERARELLLLLQDEVERNEAQRRLGLSAQTFCLHNPTGIRRTVACDVITDRPSP